jgi:hypothetical protein
MRKERKQKRVLRDQRICMTNSKKTPPPGRVESSEAAEDPFVLHKRALLGVKRE